MISFLCCFFFWVFSVSLLSAILSKVANFFVRFFFVLFSKIQCSTIFNCFSFTSTRIYKKNRAIILTIEFGACFACVCKCYIVELIESYVFCCPTFEIYPSSLHATWMQLSYKSACFCLLSTPASVLIQTIIKIKTFFAWKNKHFYNKGKKPGGTLSFDKSTDAKLCKCVFLLFHRIRFGGIFLLLFL